MIRKVFACRDAASAIAFLAALLLIVPTVVTAQMFASEENRDVAVTLKLQDPGMKSRAFVLDDLTLVPDSFWAHGGFGDTVLRNDYVTFIFGRLPKDGEEPNPQRNGMLLDIYPNPRTEEVFWLTTPIESRGAALTIRANTIETGEDETTGAAWVIINSSSTVNPALAYRTEYRLEQGSLGAKVTTTVTNNGDAAVRIDALGDYVNWGAMGAFLPSLGWYQSGNAEIEAEFIFGRYFDIYTLFMTDTGLMKVIHGATESRLLYRENLVLEPGQTESTTRWFMTELDRPAGAYGEVIRRRPNTKYGVLAGRVIERAQTSTGQVVMRDIVPNADLGVRVVKRPDLPSTYTSKFYLVTKADELGQYSILVPPGEYSVDVITPTREFAGGTHGIIVNENRVSATDHGVGPAATMVYEVVDSETKQHIPAKITMIPLRGTNPPIIGKLGTLTSEDTIYSLSGRGFMEVPRGNYRLVAAHGPEYDTTEVRASFRPNETTTVRFELRRAFEPEGWIAADLAVRTDATQDSRVTPETRIATAIIEGLQWIGTADFGKITDLQPKIEELGLKNQLRASAGYRSSSERLPLQGDFLLFPAEKFPNGVETDFAALTATATNPSEYLRALRAAAPDAILVAMRPFFPEIGYLTLLGGSESNAFMPESEFSTDFDAFQIWDGKRQAIFSAGHVIFHELRSRGLRPAMFAATGSGGTWNAEVGYPRLYIQSSTREPAKLNVDELLQNIRDGKVMVSNGPFLELVGNGLPTGSTINPDERNRVNLDLKVWSPNFAKVTAITVYVNGRMSRQVMLTDSATMDRGGLVFPAKEGDKDSLKDLRVFTDSVIEVVVESDPSIVMNPVNPSVIPSRDANIPQGQRTLAISGPIYVDADGDGVLNLPTAMMQKPAAPQDQEPPF